MQATTTEITTHQTFTGVKTAMLLHVPFFASLLLDIMDVRIGKFDHYFPPGMRPTMATDGKTIYMDQDFLDTLKIEEAVFITCHEIGHAMWDHMSRGKKYYDLGFDGQPFNQMLWNCAADYVINDMITKSGIGKMPVDPETGKVMGLLDPKYTCDMTPEEVYRLLLKDPQNGPGGKGTGQPGGNGLDGHILQPSPHTAAEMKRAIQTAVDTAKACGKLPGALKRFADELLEPQITWQDELRTTVVTAANRDTTSWARPHRRRLVSQGVYMARPAAYGCETIVVVVDTSGSIGQRELTVFFSELADIIRTCRPERVWLLGCDSRVASIEELPGDVDITNNPPEVGGGGGTDFNPPFEWVRDQGIVPDCFVYFTDLCGPGPDEEPGYPVVWCSTEEDKKGAIGKTIYVKIAQ